MGHVLYSYFPQYLQVFSLGLGLCREPGARKSKTQPIRVNECDGEYMGHVLGAGGGFRVSESLRSLLPMRLATETSDDDILTNTCLAI